MKALVVDDSACMRAFLKKILKQLGIEVAEAANGVEALSALRAGLLVDLALLDWNMPEMDGYELLSHIRSDAHFDSMQVVMVTTETETAQVAKALARGADEYIMKPFTRDVIVDKLQILGMQEPR